MSTNHAIIVDHNATGRLAIREVDLPSPSQSEALVRASAISLNLGEVRNIADVEAGWRPGWDLAGVVEQAATDGSGPKVGARVVGMLTAGAWAELVAIPTTVLAEIPDAVTFPQAATLPVAGLTALYALEKGGFLLNRKVLITGASGGVGHFACQLAHRAGAHVVACVRRVERAAGAKDAGADEVIVGEDLSLAWRSGPYHLIIDVLGGKSLVTALTLLASGGLCVNLGGAESPEATLQIRYHSVMTGGFNLYRLFLPYEIGCSPNAAADLRHLACMVADGRLHPQISVEAPWDDIAVVVQRLLNRQIAGKAVLHITH
ncbi:oxidoreductase [Reticulibacter mediterranei]|uniref:Oxidoreductase n=1 Tax=Reticulibacter mediterranei TaxID=2778369 RepID=A0A8J3ICQ9_9CHLR|nr:zinc-binding dehydrogenase [Reticulibacter mediterranei]GHO90058.1 oxidoreductase [Reticulibacter mediterranei]